MQISAFDLEEREPTISNYVALPLNFVQIIGDSFFS